MNQNKSKAVQNLERFIEKSKTDLSDINQNFLYKPRAGDVIVVGPGKSGTTWLQQILHQIRTKGDESFKDIYEVTWYMQHPKLANHFNFNAEQVCNPRIYKCHESYEKIKTESGVKFIVIVRDPYDAIHSYTKFLSRFWGSDEDFDEDKMIQLLKDQNQQTVGSRLATTSSFLCFQSWWPHRHEPNVFWIHYEDLLANLRSMIKQLADFINKPLTENELDRVHSLSTFEYMTAHSDKFTASPVMELMAQVMEQDKWQLNSTMVRADGGKAGQGTKCLGPALKKVVDDLWQNAVTEPFGFKTYKEMYAEGTRLKDS